MTAAKYLGLTLHSNLNFNKYVENLKKANATLGFIRRNIYYCQRYVKIDAYSSTYIPKSGQF